MVMVPNEDNNKLWFGGAPLSATSNLRNRDVFLALQRRYPKESGDIGKIEIKRGFITVGFTQRLLHRILEETRGKKMRLFGENWTVRKFIKTPTHGRSRSRGRSHSSRQRHKSIASNDSVEDINEEAKELLDAFIERGTREGRAMVRDKALACLRRLHPKDQISALNIFCGSDFNAVRNPMGWFVSIVHKLSAGLGHSGNAGSTAYHPFGGSAPRGRSRSGGRSLCSRSASKHSSRKRSPFPAPVIHPSPGRRSVDFLSNRSKSETPFPRAGSKSVKRSEKAASLDGSSKRKKSRKKSTSKKKSVARSKSKKRKARSRSSKHSSISGSKRKSLKRSRSKRKQSRKSSRNVKSKKRRKRSPSSSKKANSKSRSRGRKKKKSPKRSRSRTSSSLRQMIEKRAAELLRLNGVYSPYDRDRAPQAPKTDLNLKKKRRRTKKKRRKKSSSDSSSAQRKRRKKRHTKRGRSKRRKRKKSSSGRSPSGSSFSS